ncbi:V-type ATP synthase subunit A [Candidatus Magnetaquicoccus inordinatus]|uniref:V-type ATP synthase subunit A n=1 Tax=Candidatus Magnetaquicoccus inordinatus TaxID=2496818 RepID=UPI00102C92F1|nr:V-type ATP synthase subunit A [Candidatus Magnetaquicoccus inordinatus]
MSTATIHWISGPVLRAIASDSFHIHEAVQVGNKGLLGEVVRLKALADGRQEITVQLFEDTTGLRPGDLLQGQGAALSVRLGPGLLGQIFDGLLRPLSGGEERNFLAPGIYPFPDQHFPFYPLVAKGAVLKGGEPFAAVRLAAAESTGNDNLTQLCLVPPHLQGTVIAIAEAGRYSDRESVCTLEESNGQTHTLAMSHNWPVRTPRPVAERLTIGPPLLTGQRILDCLFPVARGGKATVPGGFGTGKTVLLETIAKWCNADVIIYLGCGERGNEMAGVLDEFPHLEDPRTGRPLMERMVVIANTSNMPVAAREASIYTGVTVAEYFRDQGLHVALMADSTSRWAEALREVSGRLGELPGEGGYPAYLSTRLADFYERAARVQTLSGKGGSVTLIGAVSPPSSDFSEPVTTHTKRYVRNFWALDRKRAHARFYPAIDPLTSYSEDATLLASWWHARGNPNWAEQRRRFLTILEEQSRLERMAMILGKDALPPQQQLVLLAATLINEGFLRQSAFAAKDRFASPQKQNRMMTILDRFVDLAQQAIADGMSIEQIRNLPLLRRIQRMGEEIGEEELELFTQLEEAMEKALHQAQPRLP